MAATLSLLKLPILPSKQHQTKPKLSIPSKHSVTLLPQKLLPNETIDQLRSASLPLTALTLPFFLDAKDAFAVGGEFGIFEGRTIALIHPTVMAGLFVYTLYAGYLGWQWRRVRTTQNEINELKKQVKPLPVTPEGTPVQPPKPSPVEARIQQLTEVQVNTWFRTGKLFPGPHLFAGAGITILWAAAAALVPAMQRGNETARNLHIALNALNVILFIWQIPTGIDIVFKVFEFTSWP
uniref:Uncharacterized protein n=1 Tax=Nicotiana tabacum TaxID=4097 RepID=A0A1S4C8B2_TOBAC|nr:PREDICTED: uncharacterized protein LOC107816296 [Nicotiana tabacum]